MASNRSYLVVIVQHNFHVDKIEQSSYRETEEKAISLAKEWKTKTKSTVIVYENIGEAVEESKPTAKFKSNKGD